MTLHPKLVKDPHVFSKVEDGDKLLLLQTNDAEATPLFLVAPPAAQLWDFIGDGVDAEELLRLAEASGIDAAATRNVLSVLLRNRLVSSTPPLAPGVLDGEVDDVLLDPWQYQFSKPSLEKPWFVLWELTDACPRRGECSFCYRPDSIGVEPDWEACERVIDDIIRCEVPFVTLLGGEPLCHDWIYDVISRLRAANRFVKVISNGVMIDEPAAQRLADAGLNQIALSLDGFDEATNDAIRGVGAWAAVRAALERLMQRIPRVSISLTVSSMIFDDLDCLPVFCDELGIGEVYLSPLRAVDRARYPEGASPLTSEQMVRLHEVAASCSRDGLNIVSLKECSCGRSTCVLHADGGLSPCPFGNSVFGNILDEDLATAWSRMNDAAIRLQGSSICFRHFNEGTEAQVGLR